MSDEIDLEAWRRAEAIAIAKAQEEGRLRALAAETRVFNLLPDTTGERRHFCTAPFTNLVQDPRGFGGPCPYQSGCWELKAVPIQNRWQAPAVEKMRAEYRSGGRPSECDRCANEEAAGFQSRRQFELTHARYNYDEIDRGDYALGPKIMVLRVSNFCNYACRTCHSLDSSLYKKEGEFYAKAYGDLDSRYVEVEARREFSDTDMDQMFELSGNLEELNFYGGEPMINKTHHGLLQKLVDSGRAERVSLFYCTNGSRYADSEKLKLWERFKAVKVNFSIDAIEAGYELVRWPGKWNEVEANLIRFRDKLSGTLAKPAFFGINITVSSLNIYDLPEIYARLDGLFPGEVILTTVHEPHYFSIQNIPDATKSVVEARLLGSPYAEKFAGLVSFMMAEACQAAHWKSFVLWTEKMDAYRNQSFRTVFPDYFRLLEKSYFEALGDFKSVTR